MSASFRRSFRALDLSASVTCNVPTLASTLDILTACYASLPDVAGHTYTIDGTSPYTVRVNGALLYESTSAQDVVSALELDLYENVIRAAQGRWLVHAATLESNDRALVLVGASGAGKSTMALTLVGRGARYVTDEMTLIDQDGVCRGLGRPLTLDTRPDARMTQGMRVLATSAGPEQSVWIVPPAERRSAAPLQRQIWVDLAQGPKELRRLSSGEALTAFWSQSLRADSDAFAAAAQVVSSMPAYAVRGQSIGESADLLMRLLAT